MYDYVVHLDLGPQVRSADETVKVPRICAQ